MALVRGQGLDDLPSDLEGFTLKSRVGPALGAWKVQPRQQREHTVFIENLSPSEVQAEITSICVDDLLIYVDLKSKTWPVYKDAVPTDYDVTKAELLRHEPTMCPKGQQHEVLITANLTSQLPGAETHEAKLRLTIRCE